MLKILLKYWIKNDWWKALLEGLELDVARVNDWFGVNNNLKVLPGWKLVKDDSLLEILLKYWIKANDWYEISLEEWKFSIIKVYNGFEIKDDNLSEFPLEVTTNDWSAWLESGTIDL